MILGPIVKQKREREREIIEKSVYLAKEREEKIRGEEAFPCLNGSTCPTSLVLGECQVQASAGCPSLWPLPSCIICHFCRSFFPGKELLVFSSEKVLGLILVPPKNENAFSRVLCLSSNQRGLLVFICCLLKGENQVAH